MERTGGQSGQPECIGPGRERVLAAARDLFLERGYTGVSMQEIADAAGMRKASLYYHVRDKEDLFIQVVREERQHLSAGIAAELAVATNLEDSLRRVARFFARAVRSDMSRLLSDFMHYVAPEPRAEMRQNIRDLQDQLRGCFDEAVASGEVTDIDPALATSLFTGMLTGVIRQTKEHWLDESFDEAMADKLVDIFLHGITFRNPAAG